MNTNFNDYTSFFDFIECFAPTGFNSIDPGHPLLLKVEKLMATNNQFLTVADMIQWKFLYTSKRCSKMLGIEPADLNPYHLMEATHPDDIRRHSQSLVKIFNLVGDLFSAGEGSSILSTNLRLRNPAGKYSNILVQSYLYYSGFPHKTVYRLQVHTNIDRFRITGKRFHYYVGNDFSYFKFPDNELLNMGYGLSKRELQIIKLVELGLYTEQIAEKLFISPLTVNTHRRNILHKAGKASIPELIYELR
jgi:DNA-binding CsgD family transcriptional regulator